MPKSKIILVSGFFVIFAAAIFAFAQNEFIYEAKAKRDPFIALITSDGKFLQLEKTEVTGALVLEGIIYDKNGVSYALVNGAVVKVGDEIEDYRVLKVEDKKVLLMKDGQITEIKLKKEGE